MRAAHQKYDTLKDMCAAIRDARMTEYVGYLLCHIHLAKLENRARARFFGDEDFVNIPVKNELVRLELHDFKEAVQSLGLKLEVTPQGRTFRWWNPLWWSFRRRVVYDVHGWTRRGPPEPTPEKGPADAGPWCFF